jgi:Flp pilus assembly protein TadB
MSGATTAAAVVGAAAAVAGAGITYSNSVKASKEADRQKSIAAKNQRLQKAELDKQQALADAEEKALQDKLTAENNAVADVIQKRRNRGRRSLISGSELGFTGESEDGLATNRITLG